MGNTADGGEYNLALWSMALLLYIISIVTITLIHAISNRRDNAGGRDDAADDTVKNKVRAAAGKADT
jgi:ABC-type cobalt transport system substrate-binding protein